MKSLDVFPGYKTYLIVLIGVALITLSQLGFIDSNDVTVILERSLPLLGLGTIKLALDR
ncbi:hypothetical protein LCGC14_2563230 [marine sediment metagenome]|uniref:Uncharacterized protein n=1 Tax=marine sediment metagenome TaxID=412755 RepID=A0A0F9AK29_9ZZZZ